MKKGITLAISGLLALSVLAIQMPSVNADAGKTGSAATLTRKHHHKAHKTGAASSLHRRHAAKKHAYHRLQAQLPL